MAKQTRYASLDGLRGLCALVVVIYHCLLVLPAMSIPTDGSQAQAAAASPVWSLIWWLYRTPLRALWAGPEAVLIFFVLSGFVLCLPLTSGAAPGWPAYYAKRLSRLYLPVWAAVAFAVTAALAVGRSAAVGSVWLRGHEPASGAAVLRDVTLLLGTSTLDGPLWSLRWEIWFSLLLPLCFLLLRRVAIGKHWWVAVLALATVSALATTDAALRSISPGRYLISGLLQYLPVFGIGMVLALNFDRVRLPVARTFDGSRLRTFTVGLLAVSFLVSPSWLPAAGPLHAVGAPVTAAVSLIGVVLIVLLSLHARPVARVLESGPMQWAGTRSFSIYLVHEPVIVAAALLTGAATPWPWLGIAGVAIAVALLSAEIFFRLAERPAHRFSRWIGRRIPKLPETGQNGHGREF